MDYKLIKLDGRLKGKPHWLWAGGVLGSWGLSGYYFSECNQSYKGCKIPKEFGNGNFASYRQAKLDRQNAVIFATLGATIWLVDIIQVAAKRRKLKKKGSKDFGQIDFFLDTQSLPSSTAGYTPIVGFRYQW